MWRDWRKWHPKIIKVICFWGLRKKDLLQKPPRMMQSESNESNKWEYTEGRNLRIKKANKNRSTTVTTFVFIITIGRVIIIKCMPFSEMLLWKKTALWATSVFLSLAELLWMKLKFQQSYLEKHSAYYTAQFPILSQVRTQTHKHTHTQNTKWGRSTKQSPRQAQWYKNT